MTEKQIEKIKKRIKSYRAQLTSQKRKFGWIDDGRGVRYLIPELYLKISDIKGAQRYFRWFEKEFPHDLGFPEFNIYWRMTAFENNQLDEAERMLYKTTFTNTYLVEFICGGNPKIEDKPEMISFESFSYAHHIVEECRSILSDSYLEWLKHKNQDKKYRNNMNRFVSLQKLIKDEAPGELRSKLIHESTKLKNSLTKKGATNA